MSSNDRAAPILRLEGVTKEFGGLVAVDDIDLEVTPGEMLGVIGPNGAGKSTMFKLIFGVLPLSNGKIVFKDNDITGKDIHEIANEGIAQFYQESTLMRDVSVRNNVRVSVVPNSLRQFTGSRKHTNRIQETLELCGLTEVAETNAEDITHKNKQKLELAKAIVREPDLLLLDEPFVGLTRDEADEIIEIIEQLNENGMTIITVDHNLRWLRSFVDRIIVLNYGEVIANGPSEQIVNDKRVQNAYIGTQTEELSGQ